MNLEEDFVIIGEPFSRHARKARGITNTKDILRYVQQAPNDINWTFDQAEFDDHLALKKNSAPGPDGIPYGVSRCAGGLGSKLLFSAHKAVLEGSTIPDCFAESRTVFIPKTSDIHDHGRIIRSPDALRPLTLSANSLLPAICRPLLFVEAFTGTPMRCIHTSQRCISSGQRTDNIVEIETTGSGPCGVCSARIRCSLD